MSRHFYKLKVNRRRAIICVAVAAALAVAAASYLILRLNTRIKAERDEQARAAEVVVQITELRPPSRDGLTLYLNAAAARATATFSGTRYLATSGGLIALQDTSGVKRRYTSLDGLPDNDLTALAVFRDRLYIGTAGAGLVSFDGDRFTAYRFEKPGAARVSALCVTDSELLIGTLDGGLFEYDGERFSRRFNSTAGADFTRVTALLAVDARLYIGTQDKGLYVWREAHIETLGTGEGLPSPHVTGLALAPQGSAVEGRIAVATDFGVVAIDDENQLKPISSQPNVTSLAVSRGRLWAGLFNGGMMDLSANRSRSLTAGDGSSLAEVAGLPPLSPVSVQSDGDQLWALTAEGAFLRDERGSRPAFDRVADGLVGERVLTGGHITGLAFDGAGRLWVGYFDRGIDVVAPETNERLSHIEDERVREVNFIAFDGGDDRVMAATSRGLVVFDARLRQTTLTREKDGLISDSVAHVSIGGQTAIAARGETASYIDAGHAIVLATAGGLTEVSGGRARSVTAFHGLASNHLYTSVTAGSRLFAGSLAGLVELEGLRVVRTYKTSNSKLSHDWVTALAWADGTLFIGTNGGGIDALLPTGEWVNYADDTGRFEVNQNALYYDGERLYAGTSDRGLWVYHARARRWSRISAGLPSQSVTAVASDDQFVYVGTLNGMMQIDKRVIQ